MQEVPIVTVPVIVGINSIEAVHGEAPMITAIDRTGAVKTVHVVAPDTGMDASTHTAGFDGSDVSPAKAADMTHAADVSVAANATQPGDVGTAAEATDVSTATEATDMGAATEAADVSASAEAAAHTARVAAATAAAARLCLHSKQTHRQKGRRQNRYHSFHRFLHSVMDGARHLTCRASPKLLMNQR
jgi:hypothetical protein